MLLECLTTLGLLLEELIDRELCDSVADGKYLCWIVTLPETQQTLLSVDNATSLAYRFVL